jgi:hypothetical protein
LRRWTALRRLVRSWVPSETVGARRRTRRPQRAACIRCWTTLDVDRGEPPSRCSGSTADALLLLQHSVNQPQGNLEAGEDPHETGPLFDHPVGAPERVCGVKPAPVARFPVSRSCAIADRQGRREGDLACGVLPPGKSGSRSTPRQPSPAAHQGTTGRGPTEVSSGAANHEARWGDSKCRHTAKPDTLFAALEQLAGCSVWGGNPPHTTSTSVLVHVRPASLLHFALTESTE